MILIIDNYDSFTYNLVQYVGSINKNVKTIKNNELTVKQIQSLNISHIIISPGPGRPENTGICLDVIKNISSKIPTLGICLGHQAIGFQFNAIISKSKFIMHGKTSIVKHNKKSKIFNNIPEIFNATRYHSLSIEKNFKNKHIQITSFSDDGEIMSIEHNKYPIFGIQFHPESILTEYGIKIIDNFLNIIA